MIELSRAVINESCVVKGRPTLRSVDSEPESHAIELRNGNRWRLHSGISGDRVSGCDTVSDQKADRSR